MDNLNGVSIESVEIKNSIRSYYFNKYYYRCICLCNKFLKCVKKQHKRILCDIRDELFFVYFYLGISYKNIADWKSSKYYMQKSVRYSMNNTFLNLAVKELAKFYTHIKMYDKAINSYKFNLHFYRNINDIKNRADVLFNIALIRDKPNHMQQIVYIVERINHFRGGNYSNLLTQQYIDLIGYLFTHNQSYRGRELLNNIQDINIKLQVYKKLYRKIA